MTPQLPPDEIRKLLGGYATGTLTPAEEAALFAAALEDQELFDALAREQALRDHLRDPAMRAELLAALAPPPKPVHAGFWDWLRRPLVAGLVTAGLAGIVVVGVWRASRVAPAPQTAPVIVAEALPPKAPPVAMQDAPPATATRDAVVRRKMPEAKPAKPEVVADKGADMLVPAPAPAPIAAPSRAAAPGPAGMADALKKEKAALGAVSPAPIAVGSHAFVPVPAGTAGSLRKDSGAVGGVAPRPLGAQAQSQSQAVAPAQSQSQAVTQAQSQAGAPSQSQAVTQAQSQAGAGGGQRPIAAPAQAVVPAPTGAAGGLSSENRAVGGVAPAKPTAPKAVAPPPVGGVSETVEVMAEASVVAAQMGDRKTQDAVVNSRLSANGMVAGGLARSLVALPLRCLVLRESGEVEPATPLDAGETIRLRVIAPGDGTISILEGGRVIASGAVRGGVAFDTAPLPFSGAGTRKLTLSLITAPGTTPAAVAPITLTYR